MNCTSCEKELDLAEAREFCDMCINCFEAAQEHLLDQALEEHEEKEITHS